MENIINAILDISKILLASQKIEMPETYRDTIEKLSNLGLSKNPIILLTKWIRLRNILAHEYLDLRWKKIEDFLNNGEDVCEQFLKFVKPMVV